MGGGTLVGGDALEGDGADDRASGAWQTLEELCWPACPGEVGGGDEDVVAAANNDNVISTVSLAIILPWTAGGKGSASMVSFGCGRTEASKRHLRGKIGSDINQTTLYSTKDILGNYYPMCNSTPRGCF